MSGIYANMPGTSTHQREGPARGAFARPHCALVGGDFLVPRSSDLVQKEMKNCLEDLLVARLLTQAYAQSVKYRVTQVLTSPMDRLDET